MRWLGRLVRRIGRRSEAATETDTSYDGAFSYQHEFHAAVRGFIDGGRSRRLYPHELPDAAAVQSEPHYYQGAYFLGTVAQVLVVFAAATAGLTLI